MSDQTPQQVSVFEVGPRDGLQNLPNSIPTASKIALINALSTTGLRKIEAASFVSPKWIPQLADGPDVMSGILRHPDIVYSALAPNITGAEAAVNAGCQEIAVFISASEGFSKANLNCTIEESITNIRPAIQHALDCNLTVRGYLSCVYDCPFDGAVKPDKVIKLTDLLLQLGCYEVSLGDTLGTAAPDTTKALLDKVIKSVPASKLAGHFHDTRGHALSNIECCLDFGIRTFDSSVAGLGGCPFAPGASGNVNTRAVAKHLHDLGYETNISLSALEEAETIALGFSDNMN